MKRVDLYIVVFGTLNLFLALKLVSTAAFSVLVTAFNVFNPSVLLLLVIMFVCVVLVLDTLSRLVGYIGGKDSTEESVFLYRVGVQTLAFVSFYAVFILLNGYHDSLVYSLQTSL
jgi:hypothetical protein